MKPASLRLLAMGFLSWAVAKPAFADDELSIKTRGRMQGDFQLRIEDKSTGPYYDRHALPAGPEWARATFALGIDASYRQFKGVADLEIVANGFSTDVGGIGDLARMEKVDPVRIEVRNLYAEARNLFVDGLDLRVGQQVISWGVGDQFNPTNNLNPDDLRDRLLFGTQAGNFMLKADYWPVPDLAVTAVLVPVFKPALLPQSAVLGPAAIDRLPFVSDPLRWRTEAEMAASGLLGYPTIVEAANVELPERNLDNMAETVRIAGSIGGQDLALSYYRGRHDFPVPIANHTRLDRMAAQCDPNSPSDCINGRLATTVTLSYPRMQVFGLNAAGEIPLSWLSQGLHGIGYRFEAALILPELSTIRITNDALDLPGQMQPAGEYDYDGDGQPGGPRPAVVNETPFLKWAIGLDYTFGEHVYLNAQWVHGLPDEYGAGDFFHDGAAVRASGVTSDPGSTLVVCALAKDGSSCASETYRPRLADYAVVGVDFKLKNNALLLRLFTILDLSGMTTSNWDDARAERVTNHHSPFSAEGFSAVIYPELNYNFGNGLDLGLGALLQLGKNTTKFGDPAAGGSLVWSRARFAF